MKYDYVFVTPLPSFYKINLYNELAKKMNILVIFIGESSIIRTEDFTKGDKNFDYEILNKGSFEEKNSFFSCIKLINLLFRVNYKKIVVGGWDFIEYWLCIYINSKVKNGVIVESTSIESSMNFIKKNLKKVFFKRISLAFPSGQLHSELLKKLDYKNKIVYTKGVGIFHRVNYSKRAKKFENKFLYIGRLSEEKNLDFLVDFFNKNSQYSLTIVGNGPMKEDLAIRASHNTKFIGHVANERISEMYLEHDVFILPSNSEPWGLVIDEALYFNIPVIVSKNVGCASELVLDRCNGIILEQTTDQCLLEAINDIKNRYDEYKINVSKINFSDRDNEQVNAYVRGLK